MTQNRITFQHRLEYIGWKLVTGTLKFVPRRGMVILADMIGWLMYSVFHVRRDVVDQQLKMALGDTTSDAERRRIGCLSWQNCVMTFFEFLQPNPIGSTGWNDFHNQEGYEEHCLPFVEKETPALILTGHIGNWEALGRLGRREQVQLVAIAKPMHNPLVNQSILDARAMQGLEIIQVKGNMKGIVDAMRDQKWVAFLGDQDARRRGIFVDFFGQPASTALGAAHFSYKMNVPILPSFCVRMRDPHRTLKVIFMPPIYPDTSADRDSELQRITQEHTKALEQVIRQHPGDYFWLHRRWKTKPKRAAKLPTEP